jgi:hypothetical protein
MSSFSSETSVRCRDAVSIGVVGGQRLKALFRGLLTRRLKPSPDTNLSLIQWLKPLVDAKLLLPPTDSA